MLFQFKLRNSEEDITWNFQTELSLSPEVLPESDSGLQKRINRSIPM